MWDDEGAALHSTRMYTSASKWGFAPQRQLLLGFKAFMAKHWFLLYNSARHASGACSLVVSVRVVVTRCLQVPCASCGVVGGLLGGNLLPYMPAWCMFVGLHCCTMCRSPLLPPLVALLCITRTCMRGAGVMYGM